MTYSKDFSITKMSVLKVASELMIHNAGTDKVDIKSVVELADKLAAWAYSAESPYVKPKETK